MNRLRPGADLRATVRTGVRTRGRFVTAHTVHRGDSAPPRIGFVVSRHSSGGSVSRHRVTRRLRHVVRAIVPGISPGLDVVVRALPAATDATPAQLRADVGAVLGGAGR